MSYVRADDDYTNGGISWACDRLEKAAEAITGRPFVIFQDVRDIQPGDDWEERLNWALDQTQLFVPIMTPRFFESPYCRREAEAFLDRADGNALIMPIYLIEAERLEDKTQRSADELAAKLHQRQFNDWRRFKHQLADPDARQKSDINCRIEGVAKILVGAAKRNTDMRPKAKAGPGTTPRSPKGPEYIIWDSEKSPSLSADPLYPQKNGRHRESAIKEATRFIDRVSERQVQWGQYLLGLIFVALILDTGSEWVRYIWATDSRQDLGSFSPSDASRRESIAKGRTDSAFRDCGGCPWMVIIPAGSFVMGSDDTEEGRDRDEGPQRRVTIDNAFALGLHEVTRGEFALFISETGYTATGCRFWDGDQWIGDKNRSWRDPGYQQSDDHPIACVSWNDAQAYVRWLERKTDQDYRLPSEAEWEYAARAGTTTPYFWGEETDSPCRHANGLDSLGKQVNGFDRFAFSCNDGYPQTAPVGTFEANAFGLYDMAGNVWEWVDDPWHPTYEGAPIDGKVWIGGGSSWRMHRGGSWSFNPWNLRSANRRALAPDERNFGLGFRVARTLGSDQGR